MRKEMIDMPKFNTMGVQTSHGVRYAVWRSGSGDYACFQCNGVGPLMLRAWSTQLEAHEFIDRLLAGEVIDNPYMGKVVWVGGRIVAEGASIAVVQRHEDYAYGRFIQPHEQYNAAMNYDNR